MRRTSALLVGIFYPLIVLVAVLLLAVVQLRSSAGSDFDVWRLNYRSAESLREPLKKEYDSVSADLASLAEDLLFFEDCLKKLDDKSFVTNILEGEVGKKVRERLLAPGVTYKSFRGNERCVARQAVAWQIEHKSGEYRKQKLETQLEALKVQVKTNENRLDELVRRNRDFPAFLAMEETGDWYISFAPRIQYDLLILLLVMFMGALGGMVRLLRDYGDVELVDPKPRDYFFVPLIGLVVAVGGYVLAKTGLLLLSSTKQETSLSPFMIGLVGIISGLLAREVIDAIARTGANMMQGSGKTTRRKPRRAKAGG